MTPQEYTGHAAKTAVYPREHERDYLALGLLSELGEVAGVLKRVLRDDAGVLTAERAQEGRKEVGDCLWYLAMLRTFYGLPWGCWTERPAQTLQTVLRVSWSVAEHVAGFGYAATSKGRVLHLGLVEGALAGIAGWFGATLEECAEINVAKLADRAGRGVIHGAGDAR